MLLIDFILLLFLCSGLNPVAAVIRFDVSVISRGYDVVNNCLCFLLHSFAFPDSQHTLALLSGEFAT